MLPIKSINELTYFYIFRNTQNIETFLFFPSNRCTGPFINQVTNIPGIFRKYVYWSSRRKVIFDMFATLPCSLTFLPHTKTGSRSVHLELSIRQHVLSIRSHAKGEIYCIIRFLVWKGKPPVEVYNEVKTACGDKAMNRTTV